MSIEVLESRWSVDDLDPGENMNNTRAFELVKIALRHANRLGVYEGQDSTLESCHEHTLFFNAIRKGEYRELLDWIKTLDERAGLT